MQPLPSVGTARAEVGSPAPDAVRHDQWLPVTRRCEGERVTTGLFVLLAGAGLAAGLCGSIAGLASLFSYPALLAAGLPATTANITNTVSLAVSSIGSVTGSRPELVGQARAARRLGVVCLVGGATGAGLLLITPPGVFQRVVPFLVAGASLLLLVGRPGPEAPLSGSPGTERRDRLTVLGVLAVAVYSGYFGAAAGVIMLALLLAATPESLHRINALKNVLAGLANTVAAVAFAVFGHVAWWCVLPLTLGLLLGSWLGPGVARRLPSNPLRIGIAVAGLGLAVKLGLDAF
jgi:uncharacterized membrane protein YfcA